MDGKVCIITGATSGVGRAAAQGLAERGATVGVVGRDPAKGRDAVAEIQKSAIHPDSVVFLRADLAELQQVRDLAAQIRERFGRVDVLVNNAGLINVKRSVTRDGYENTFAVNHLAHFLLTGLLLDLLKKAAPSRVINVSSDAHKIGKLDLDDLQSEKSYSTFGVYARSKLANIYFTYELARRLEGTGVTVNAMHPGAIASNFGKNNGRLSQLVMRLVKPFFLTPVQGAETAVYLATAPEVEGVTGRYFYKKKDVPSTTRSHDASIARQLWDASERMTGYPYSASA
jgi:retinol dehydrogenase 12